MLKPIDLSILTINTPGTVLGILRHTLHMSGNKLYTTLATTSNGYECFNAAASMASGKKKRRTEEENREFNQDCTESFAFIYNTYGLPTCLICHEKLAHNKKSNLERHFTTKHTQFAGKYPASDARKKAVEELRKNNNSQVPC
ncbi:hypothetical protein AVEN_101394-1 [Araneus ventricosus]|uniref:SPIN-DOC-like zinc-finger domain-containing protein n=1 Tax=Araneus ventricosus TaxID=182803 RepID=A0A4Y2TLY9_ARAVE|nr:hypothetical protein AVEN_101394-1 [Araneus ventricosus]